MRLIGGNSLNTLLLILMSITHSSSLLGISSRWYGQGCHWINLGLSIYAAMNRKPDNGEEIQNAEIRPAGIIMRLSIVKYASNEEDQEDYEDNLPHDTKVLKELVLSWTKMDRIICADS